MSASTAEKAAFSEQSRQSILRSNYLCTVLDLSHKKIVNMKNSIKQCVLSLYDPSHSAGDPALKEGSVSWFVRSEFFRNVSVEPSMDQALRILHDPHDEYVSFIKRATIYTRNS
jgi:hypothetical protein